MHVAPSETKQTVVERALTELVKDADTSIDSITTDNSADSLPTDKVKAENMADTTDSPKKKPMVIEGYQVYSSEGNCYDRKDCGWCGLVVKCLIPNREVLS